MRMLATAMISARKVSAFSAKHAASDKAASSAPAIGGPIKRPLLNSMAFSASALGKSSRRPTKLPISDCRNGVSKLLSTPSRPDIATSSHGLTQPSQVNAASASACTVSKACTHNSARRLSCLSTHAPANGPTSSCGISAANAVTPSKAAEPVSRYTSQAIATC